jgi:uncharacterized protein (TIGR02646 family)
MIRIRKGAAPDVLRTRGGNARRSHSMRYTHDPGAFRSGAKTFDFKASIYAHPTVKQALIEAQHGKCCFCESKTLHVIHGGGDVEHFRPKAAVRQRPGDALQRPGYYWLAYDWHNLFFACQVCNRRAKGNLFPLRDPSARARSHHDDVAREEPLFVHPGDDDPEVHIEFREAVAYPRGGSDRGTATIRALDLNHDDLYEVRIDYYEAHAEPLATLRRAMRSPRTTPQEKVAARRYHRALLGNLRAKAQQARTPYASMLRAAVAALAP